MQKKKGIFNVIKSIWKVLEKILMIAIAFISITIVTQRVSNNENCFLGFRIFRVETGSMIPKYQIGDVILVKETDIDKIKVGDDVTYYGTAGSMKGKIVTHQVIGIMEEDGQRIFETKGIANMAKDPIISGDQIDGVVQCKMHIVTWLVSLMSNGYIFYFGIVIPLTIWIFFSVIKSNVQKYDKMATNQEDDDEETENED